MQYPLRCALRSGVLAGGWLAAFSGSAAPAVAANPPTNAPFPYVWATAYHLLPETTSEESGYFSLCEGRDGSIYVGTAKYGANSYLVEFDPVRFAQRIVIDTRKVCGLNATGYAAQAKLHTRNFVGQSGKIYVGSKQGYRVGKDTSVYPGGYVMSYDPLTGRAENLGRPLPEQGIIDVVTDEARGLLYAVTCEDQHWMLGKTGDTNSWRELGPLLTPYATTLIDAQGRAHALSTNFDLCSYDPVTDRVSVRPVLVGKHKFTHATPSSIPTWNLAADGKTAYLILMNDPVLYAIDLSGKGSAIKAVNCGRLTGDPDPDSRAALSIGPDGRVWTLIRTSNNTGFGNGMLHRLIRYDPKKRKIEDLGVLAVKNPDFYDFSAKQPHSHGYHTLPDGTLTPLHAHMGLIVARDNSLYATILYPYSLLRIEGFKTPPPPAQTSSPAAQVLEAVLKLCDDAEKQLPQAVRVGEAIAERHLNGGAIGAWWENGCLGPELYGRAGNLVNIGYDRVWTTNRTDREKSNDIAIVGIDWPPFDTARRLIALEKMRSAYIVGFGPQAHPDLSNEVAACTAFFDTGFATDDRVVRLDELRRAGHLNHLANALHGWMVMAEATAALTRKGRTPTFWKSYSYPDGREWGARYMSKKQFHDEITVPPQAPGVLAQTYIDRIRYFVRCLKTQQLDALQKAAELIAAEHKHGRKTVVAWAGHMPEAYVGRFEDKAWSQPVQLHPFLESQRKDFRDHTPDGALVVRLGYQGIDPQALPLFLEKKNRLICLAGANPDPAWQMPPDALVNIDLVWPFGDGCVTLEGYPFPVFAPSGIIQAAAYSALCAEVEARIIPRP
ncbi:MAG: hypothetical protein WCL16_09230 [bacterium]